jgi:serine/threonine protein phosphatase PrpC
VPPQAGAAEEAVVEGVVPGDGEPDGPQVGAADRTAAEPEDAIPTPAEDQLVADDEDLLELDDDVVGFWREEREPVQSVEVGTLLADRYQIMEALDVQKEGVLYQAYDLVRCWQCGFEGNTQGDAFCAKCGAAQDRRVPVRLLQVRDGGSELPEGETVAARFVHDGQTFLLLAQEGPEAREEASQVWGIRLLVGQRSDAGEVRELDEDSLLALTMIPNYEARVGPVLGLFSVADGLGGHEGGEIASKMAIHVLADQTVRHIILPVMAGELVLDEDVAALLRQATIAANDAVYLARQKRGNDMGTTLTTVLVRDERLFLAHVGDSRAYRWNAEGLEQLTTDHSVVASMIAEGRAAPEEIYSHPHRNVVYRCIGDKPTVEVDTDILPLAPGDRIVLCSDGLWEMIRDAGIEDVMLQEADPQTAADLLVKHANVAGGQDNISVIVLQVETM